MNKVCVTHHVTITTTEQDLQHMGAECIVYDNSGQDLGGIAPIQGNAPETTGPFDDNQQDLGTVLPYESKEEKEKMRKQHGIPITKPPKSA